MVGLCVWGLGCATLSEPTVRRAAGAAADEAAEEAVPTVVDQALESLNKPESRRILADLLTLPALRTTGAELAGGAVEGAAAALGDADRTAAIAQVTETLTASLAGSLNRELTPVLRSLAAAAVASALHEATSAPETQRLRIFLGELGAAVTRDLSAELRTQLGPALGGLIRDEIGPALRTMLIEDVGAALDELLQGRDGAVALLARTASREAVLGANAALAELALRPSPGPLGQLGSAAKEGATWLGWLVPIGLVAVALLAAALVRTSLAVRRDRREARRREAAMILLVDAMRGSRDGRWSEELDELLRTRLADREGADYLRSLLRPPEQRNH